MEIELKYMLDSEETAKAIFNDPVVTDLIEEGTLEELKMEAIYFDTLDRRLGKSGVAVRTRREGKNLVSTMKYGGNTIPGLFSREEINVNLSSEDQLLNPSAKLFKGTNGEEILEKVVEGETLLPLLQTDFLRKKAFLNDGNNRFEIAVDRGKIIAGGKTAPIFELEIEIYKGDEKALLSFGNILKKKYNLVEGKESKYKRGLDLLKKSL